MARKNTQISAYIADEVKARIERYVRAHGVTKAHLIETALLHHLQALRELPADVVIPPRITVTTRSMERLAALLEQPPEPTDAMRALFSDDEPE